MYRRRRIGRSYNLGEFVAFCEELEKLPYVWGNFVPYAEDTDLELQDVDPQEFEDILNGG